MARLSDELYEDLLELLGDHDLASRLRAEQERALSNSAGDVVTLEIPLSFVPHVRSAMTVGATTSMMCQENDEAVVLQRSLAERLAKEIPPIFSVFLHRSDVTRIFDILSTGGEWRLKTSWNDRPTGIEFREKGGTQWSDFFLRIEARKSADEALWLSLDHALRQLQDRMPIGRSLPKEPVEGEDFQPL